MGSGERVSKKYMHIELFYFILLFKNIHQKVNIFLDLNFVLYRHIFNLNGKQFCLNKEDTGKRTTIACGGESGRNVNLNSLFSPYLLSDQVDVT